MQWYGREFVGAEGVEKDEIIKKLVERGWGIWYQADIIGQKVLERRVQGSSSGEVIGEEESLRVLVWMDEARRMAGIEYDGFG